MTTNANKFRNGFTVIEIMVTVAVASVLVAVAIPSFQDIIRKNRLEAESQRVFISFKQARNDAISTNTPSFVCRSTDAQTTLNGGIACRTNGMAALDWNNDLMVYSYIPGQRVINPNNRYANQRIQRLQQTAGLGGGAQLVRRQMVRSVSESSDATIVSTANRNDLVLRFNADGTLNNASPFRVSICDDSNAADRYGKIIEVNASGQITLSSVDTNNDDRDCTPN